MPKRMTPQKTSSSKPTAKQMYEGPYRCYKCGRVFSRQKGNFPSSQSVLWSGNNYYQPLCYNCIDQLYMAYCNDCGLGTKGAIRRMCSKLDVYWSPTVYEGIEVSPGNSPTLMREYLKRINLGSANYSKTYDDTLSEQAQAAMQEADVIDDGRDAQSKMFDEIDPKVILFWGANLGPQEYKSLQERYDRWIATGKYQQDDPAIQTLLRQICITQYDIAKGRSEGKAVDKQQATLNTYLGSLNAKPSQRQEVSSSLDGMPFGVAIQRWQNTRPIPEPTDEWKDVDHIVHYTTVWFIGHLCRMLHIDNRYSKMYQDEIAKLTVDRPQYEEDSIDTESVFDELFGGGGDSG